MLYALYLAAALRVSVAAVVLVPRWCRSKCEVPAVKQFRRCLRASPRCAAKDEEIGSAFLASASREASVAPAEGLQSSSSASSAVAESSESSSESEAWDAALVRALEAERRKATSLEKEALEAAKAEELHKWASLVVSNLWRCEPRTTSLEVEDWDTGEKKVLRFSKDPRLQAEEAFRKCRRMRRGSAVVAKLLDESRRAADRITEVMDIRDVEAKGLAATELGIVTALTQNVFSPGDATRGKSKRQQQQRHQRGKRRPWSGRVFEAPVSKAPILVGRNRAENDYLSCVLAKDGDYWLHARGNAGAHVLLQLSTLPKSKGPPHQEDLQLAADAAAFYSDVKADTKVTVTVALPKHVIKPPRAPPGAVTLRQEHSTLIGLPDRHRRRHADALGLGEKPQFPSK